MIMEAQTLADFHRLRDALRNRVIGQDAAVDAILTGLLTNEPILLQGNAGFGQSLLATTLSQLLGLSYNQIVCSPDLTPTDIIGTPNAPGPLCAKVVLMDQIHQARPGIKALLLNVMDSRQVLLGGTRQTWPRPPGSSLLLVSCPLLYASAPVSMSRVHSFSGGIIPRFFAPSHAAARIHHTCVRSHVKAGPTASPPPLGACRPDAPPRSPPCPRNGPAAPPRHSQA
jgi:hypothetical protein